MVDICKRSYIINAIKEYCFVRVFLLVQGFPRVYVFLIWHVYLST
jgi:hypothetical protein